MKKTILIIFSMIIFNVSFSQTAKENLENDFNTYINLTSKQKFVESHDYIAEEYFKIFPKDQLIDMWKFHNSNSSFNEPIRLESSKILKVENIKKIKKKYYSILTYSKFITMRFLTNEEIEEETKEAKKKRINSIKISLTQKYGNNNVVYNEETDFFEIHIEKSVCAISKNRNKNWKFATIEKEQKYLFEKIIPKEILNRI